MSTNLIAGEDVHFDYSNNAYKSHSVKKSKKGNIHKDTQRKMQVHLNDPNSDYPTSRVIKQEANGEVTITPITQNHEIHGHHQQHQQLKHSHSQDDEYDEEYEGYCSHHHCKHDHHNEHEDYEYDDDDDDEEEEDEDEDEDDEHYHCPHHDHDHDHDHHQLHNSHNHSHNHSHEHHHHHHNIQEQALGTVEQQKEVIQHQSKKPVFGNYLWDSDTPVEEQTKIKEFWMGLPETKRKSIISVSNDEVMTVIRDEQNSNCNCKMCGNRKFTLERELEKLYQLFFNAKSLSGDVDGNQINTSLLDFILGVKTQKTLLAESLARFTSQSNSNINDQNNKASGSSVALQNKNVMSVAEDLLKNNGKKFIDMVEQLDSERNGRENLRKIPGAFPTDDNHDHDSESEFEYDGANDLEEDEEDYDDDGEEDEYSHYEDEYDDDEDDEDDDEEEDENLDTKKRIEETYKLWQLITSKILKTKLMAAYKEKSAEDNKRQLIEELEAEEKRKKAKDEEKKKKKEKIKEKKRQLQLAKEEERKRKEQERLEQEKSRKEELKRKTEEGRKKKEAERKKRDEQLKRKKEEQKRRREAEQERLRKEKEERELKKQEDRKRREEERKRKEDEKKKRQEAKILQREKEKAEQDERERQLQQLQQQQLQRQLLGGTAGSSTTGQHTASSSSLSETTESSQGLPSSSKIPSGLTNAATVSQPLQLQPTQSELFVPPPDLPPGFAAPPQLQQQQQQHTQSIVPPPPGFAPLDKNVGTPGVAHTSLSFGGAPLMDLPTLPGLNSGTPNAATASGTAAQLSNAATAASSPWGYPAAQLNTGFNNGGSRLLNSAIPTATTGTQTSSSMFSSFPLFSQPGGAVQVPTSVPIPVSGVNAENEIDLLGNYGLPPQQTSHLTEFSSRSNSLSGLGGTSALQSSNFFGNNLTGLGGSSESKNIWGGSSANTGVTPDNSIWNSTSNGLAGGGLWSNNGANNSNTASPPGLHNKSPLSGGIGTSTSPTNNGATPSSSASSLNNKLTARESEIIQLEVFQASAKLQVGPSGSCSIQLLYHYVKSLLTNQFPNLTLEQFVYALSLKLSSKLSFAFEIIYDDQGTALSVRVLTAVQQAQAQAQQAQQQQQHHRHHQQQQQNNDTNAGSATTLPGIDQLNLGPVGASSLLASLGSGGNNGNGNSNGFLDNSLLDNWGTGFR